MSEKITIIIGTNRPESVSGKLALQYAEMLKKNSISIEIIDLNKLSETFMFSELYGNRSESFSQLVQSKISEVQKFLFVIPEYNGGFPGSYGSIHKYLKLFKSQCSVF